jgi:hypothetical protein
MWIAADATALIGTVLWRADQIPDAFGEITHGSLS